MTEHVGKQAIVIGAGMAGLPAARVLSDFFDKVIVLESDTLPCDAAPRPGTPQARHLHAPRSAFRAPEIFEPIQAEMNAA